MFLVSFLLDLLRKGSSKDVGARSAGLPGSKRKTSDLDTACPSTGLPWLVCFFAELFSMLREEVFHWFLLQCADECSDLEKDVRFPIAESG